MKTMSPDAPLEHTLRSHLQDRGLKRTRQRELIFAVLRRSEGHVTIEQLVDLVRHQHAGIGQATVYRTVRLFEEAGILVRHSLGGAKVHYELVGPEAEHHDHLVCTTCGRIFEFTDTVIEARQEALAAAHGMRLVSHSHVIRGECAQPGRCDDCAHCHGEG